MRAVSLLMLVSIAGCEYYPSEGDLTPASIQIVSGDGQLRAAGLAVRIPPSVKVVDANGTPVAGVPVEFVARGSAVVNPAVVSTDESGIASVSQWTLRTDGGADTLIARTANRVSVSVSATSLVFTDISVANDVSCGLATGGIPACWGNPQSMVRQTGEEKGVWRPRIADPDIRFNRIAAGTTQVCGLTPEHRIFCAGFTDYTTPSHFDFQEFGGGRRFVDVEVLTRGPRCAIGEDSYGYCWGTPLDPVHPVLLPNASPTSVRQLAVSYYWISVYGEPRARVCSLDLDGRVHCYDAFQSLLDGPWVSQTSARFDSIAIGPYFGCGLQGQETWCWGNRSVLALVPDSTRDVSRLPLPPVTQLTIGGIRGCALTDQGVYCFGNGVLPAIVPGTTELDLVKISISETHACGLDRFGGVWCWGDNSFGQLGNGSFVASPVPVRVQPDL